MNTMLLKMYVKFQDLMSRDEGQDLVEIRSGCCSDRAWRHRQHGQIGRRYQHCVRNHQHNVHQRPITLCQSSLWQKCAFTTSQEACDCNTVKKQFLREHKGDRSNEYHASQAVRESSGYDVPRMKARTWLNTLWLLLSSPLALPRPWGKLAGAISSAFGTIRPPRFPTRCSHFFRYRHGR